MLLWIRLILRPGFGGGQLRTSASTGFIHSTSALYIYIYICICIWGCPKIRGTFLGVPIIRIIVFWGLYWGPLILGNYQLPHINIYPYIDIYIYIYLSLSLSLLFRPLLMKVVLT